jgi:glycosyltransferase involved in cell wall biosynthesis
MRVALVHDWLITWRGGEKVLLALAELFPQADVFTLFHQKGAMPPQLEARHITASFLDRLPNSHRYHRHFLPLMPMAVRALDLSGYDLVISSSHCVAKGVAIPAGAKHLSYVHAPLRYMWDRFDDYFGEGRSSAAVRASALALRPFLRAWDVSSSKGVDRFVANSHHVAKQIAARYGRVASVVHPFVELERFTAQSLEGTGQGGYFLWVGALAPYKRLDVAIAAFEQLGLPLWVSGAGQDGERLTRAGPNIKALGMVPDADLPALYRGARALIFPGEEDFGLVPVECMASGRPVVALGKGGAVETVTPDTGLLFAEATSDALVDAIGRFDAFEKHFSPARARAHAQGFSKSAFIAGIQREVDALLKPDLET